MTSGHTSAVSHTAPSRVALRALPFLVLGVFAVVHLVLALRFPLATDETYYWEWSRRPAWGYYDQGPMIAWWIRAGCLFFGDTVLGVRLPIVLASLLTQVALYLLFRDLFDPKVALVAVAISGITPLALVGGFVATYDPLLVLFWSWAMYFAHRAFTIRKHDAWIGLGVSIGLGLLSKHTMLLFIPSLALFALSNKKHPLALWGSGILLSTILAVIMFLPSLHWQSTHDWMTFRHLFLLTGKGADRGVFSRLVEYIGSQAALITPLLFVAFLVLLARTLRDRNRQQSDTAWFLFCMSAPVLVFFLALSLKSRVQANWAACAWLAPAGLYAQAFLTNTTRPNRRFNTASVSLCAILSLMMVGPELRVALGIHVPQNWDIQTSKLFGGSELGAAADRERDLMAKQIGGPVSVGAVTYDIASRLAFYVSGHPETWCLFLQTRLNSYALWNERGKPPAGGSALLVDDCGPDDPRRPRFEAVFDRVEPVRDPVTVYWPGVYTEPVHVYHLYRCFGYRPNTTAEVPAGG